MIEENRSLRRFAVMVEHLIEHTRSHAAELSSGRALFTADSPALPLLDRALAELGVAHASLDAFLATLGPRPAGGDAHRDEHGHSHDHEHGHVHTHDHTEHPSG